jgi:hypothetical protein
VIQVPSSVLLHLFRIPNGYDRSMMDPIMNLFDAGRIVVLASRNSVFDEMHLSSAFMHAARSLIGGTARAREPSIEVLRWLSGSRQVNKALSISSPGKGEEYILAAVTLQEWPIGEDAVSPPMIIHTLPRSYPTFMQPVDPDSKTDWYGGTEVLSRMGLGSRSDPSEARKAILEAVALTDLY